MVTSELHFITVSNGVPQLLRGRPRSVTAQASELRECEIGITPFDCPCDKSSTRPHRSAPPAALPPTAMTLDRHRPALRSTRNSLRTAVQG
jgi:hypothetical protein